MKKMIVTLSAALALFATFGESNAKAQEATSPPGPETPKPGYERREYTARVGPQLGARIAYAAGAGSVYSGLSVASSSNGALPMQIDLGWRIMPLLHVGVYGQYAPVFLETNPLSCPEGFSCSAQDWRFGIQADFHPLPLSRWDPYVGVGMGYEILHTGVDGTTNVPTPSGTVPAAVDASVVDRGWEFATLTFGFDYRVNDLLGIGPFISGSLNRYDSHTGTRNVVVSGTLVSSTQVESVDHVMHEIFMIGLRGVINPGA